MKTYLYRRNMGEKNRGLHTIHSCSSRDHKGETVMLRHNDCVENRRRLHEMEGSAIAAATAAAWPEGLTISRLIRKHRWRHAPKGKLFLSIVAPRSEILGVRTSSVLHNIFMSHFNEYNVLCSQKQWHHFEKSWNLLRSAAIFFIFNRKSVNSSAILLTMT